MVRESKAGSEKFQHPWYFLPCNAQDLRRLWVCVLEFLAEPSNVSVFVWGDKWKQILWNKSSLILADIWVVSRVCGPILKALLNIIRSACPYFKTKHHLPYLTGGTPRLRGWEGPIAGALQPPGLTLPSRFPLTTLHTDEFEECI